MTMGANQDTLFFASEGEMLDFLCRRLHITIGGIYYPKAGQHLKWLEDCKLDAPQVKELEMYTYSWGGYGSVFGSMADDDDGWDWRNSGTRSTAMREKQDEDNRVWIGGRRKTVPLPLQEELLKYDMMIEDRLPFSPKHVRPLGEGRSQVFGMLNNTYKAVLYSVLTTTADHVDREWTVRPIGVYVRPSGEPTIIVKLVSTFGETKEISPPAIITDPSTLGYDINEEGDELRYFGAYGARYSEREWYVWTAGGCSYCGKVIHLKDHRDLVWINNESNPLCIGCSDKMKDDPDFEEEIPYV